MLAPYRNSDFYAIGAHVSVGRSLAPMSTDFGKRLKAARKHAGLTQKVLAARAGVSQSNLAELETTGSKSGFTTTLAACCGVNAHWVATGEGEMLGALVLREPPPSYSLRDTLLQLGLALDGLDPLLLRPLAQMLSDLALNPGRALQIATMAEALIAAYQKPKAA